ncbi:hypothetical protein [Burkholderia cepacia]|uniref:hypothetical protein n=1 Tax=Burkholderia cepacia TaxID=292 RepID=UPI001CF1B28B|nr:hypothetical protein [Burkholderia cepacia]MCA8348515.1 hypothetical protein [Burkholderia cepacia]
MDDKITSCLADRAAWLNSLTQDINEARTAAGGGEPDKRKVNVEPSLESNTQLSEAGKTGRRIL